jgi:hypothetical protein
MKSSLLCIAALAIAPLCAAAPALTDAQKASIEKAVLAADDNAAHAGSERSPERLFDFVLDGDKGPIVMNGVVFRTREEARTRVRENLRALSRVEYRWKLRLVTVLAADLALVVSEGEAEGVTTQGASFTAPFAQTAVWTLRNGEWKILHAHQSAPPRR